MKSLEATLQSLQTAMANPTPFKQTPAVHLPAVMTPATRLPVPATSARTSLPAGELPAKPRQAWEELPLKDNPQAEDELTRLLYQAFASQKTYGDKAQMMGYRDGMFQLVLARFPIYRIREAFIEHVSRKADLPTPSDIVNLIDPLTESLSPALYVALQKRVHQGEYLLRDERDFCEAFRRQEMAKVRSGSDTLYEADKEIASWKTLPITAEA